MQSLSNLWWQLLREARTITSILGANDDVIAWPVKECRKRHQHMQGIFYLYAPLLVARSPRH